MPTNIPQPYLNQIVLGQIPSNAILEASELAEVIHMLQATTSANTTENQNSLLASVVEDILNYRTQLEAGKKPRELSVQPATDNLLKFQSRLQAGLLTAQVLESNDQQEVQLQTMSTVNKILHPPLALHDELQFLNRQLGQINPNELAERYNKRLAVCFYLDEKVYSYLHAEGDLPSAINTQTPLGSLQSKNTEQILSYVIKAVPITDEINNAINAIMFDLMIGAHVELNPSQIAEDPNTLFNDGVAMFNLVETLECREALGGNFAPYLSKLIQSGEVAVFDLRFRTAYFDCVSFLTRYYAKHPITQNTAPAIPATNQVPVSPDQQTLPPIAFQVPTQKIPITTQQQPVITPLPQTPLSTPVAPTADTATPTVDFRHTVATPAPTDGSSAPAADPSKIKPLNLP